MPIEGNGILRTAGSQTRETMGMAASAGAGGMERAAGGAGEAHPARRARSMAAARDLGMGESLPVAAIAKLFHEDLQVLPDAPGARVIRPESLVEDIHRLAHQGLGFVRTAGVLEHQSQVVELDRHVGVLAAEEGLVEG